VSVDAAYEFKIVDNYRLRCCGHENKKEKRLRWRILISLIPYRRFLRDVFFDK
jgi:hypothetical protein